MSDIRINALATTATTPASDDYLALDGSANGTRKILATNIANNVSDVILGASGPSVKSTLSARAPRQGLVFDGTSAPTVTVPAVGTADFSIGFWVTPNTSVAYGGILTSINGGIYLISLTPKILNESSAVVVSANAALTLSKNSNVVYTRSGTTGTWYINGVAAGSGTDSTNYSVAWSYIGSTLVGTLGGLNLYNRALSASEVVALYEAGAPSGADYNSASNTATNTSAVTNSANTNFDYDTFTGASATGFTAGVTSSANGSFASVNGASYSVVTGTRYLATFSATLTSGTAPRLSFGSSVLSNLSSNVHTVTAGSNSVIFTITATGSRDLYFHNLAGESANYTISGLSVTRLGLLLAPDAAQAGGGLTWYDTSGNAANIALPASGVSWNVPSSGYWGGNLTVSGTGQSSVGGYLSINSALAGSTYGRLISGTTTAGLPAFFATNAVNASLAIDFPSASVARVRTNAASEIMAFAIGTTERARFETTGNFLLGTTTDTGEKLQVNGTGYFAGASIQLGNSTVDALYRVSASNGKSSDFGDDTTGGFVRANNSQSLRFITAGNIVLTLDSSSNATFGGTIKPQQAATASAPTYVKGTIYFDTTLNKLRVGGATGWETITSV